MFSTDRTQRVRFTSSDRGKEADVIPLIRLSDAIGIAPT